MDSRRSLALLIGAILAGPGIAQAQDELGEVIVTAPRYVSTEGNSASKSDIPLVEMPQSVSVVSRDMIDLLNWTSLNESVRYSAGATGEAFGPDERYDWLQVRGFDPVQFIDGTQAPIGSVNNTGTDLYGSESVEILKGPSAVLYGQTPPGGIVNMVSRRPRDEFGGELEVQGGEYNMWQVAGDVTGPVQRAHQRTHHRALPRPRDAGGFPDLEAAVHFARLHVPYQRRHGPDAARQLPGRRPREPEHGLPADLRHGAAESARPGAGRPEPRRDGLQQSSSASSGARATTSRTASATRSASSRT